MGPQGTSVRFRSTRSSTQGVERITLDGEISPVDCSWPDASVSWATVTVFQRDNLPNTRHTLVFEKTSDISKVAVVW